MSRAAIAAVAVVAVALTGVGAGYANGDAAVYAAQALDGDLGQRVTHLGYIALAAALARFAGPTLPVWLDAVTALCAGVAVVAAAVLARQRGGVPAIAALLTGCAVLPFASFGEVDLPWISLVLVAAAARRAPAAVAYAGAVTISPVALLAGPLVVLLRPPEERARHGLALLLSAAAVVAAVSVWSGGDWWVGDRGVLVAPAPRPGRALAAWLTLPPAAAVLIALAGWRSLRPRRRIGGWAIAAAPLLLAPPDVPAWLVLWAALAVAAAVAWRGVERRALRLGLAVALVAQAATALIAHRQRCTEVAREHRIATAVADALGPNDGLVASWTWGARVSVIATDDPYALPWRTPGPLIRDQADRWCGRAFEWVYVLPPDLDVPGVVAQEVSDGVRRAAGGQRGWASLPGC